MHKHKFIQVGSRMHKDKWWHRRKRRQYEFGCYVCHGIMYVYVDDFWNRRA